MSDSPPRRKKRSVQTPAKTDRSSSKSRKRASRETKDLTPGKIMQAFEGTIEPVTPTLMYRLCALLVSFVMVLLPLIYVAMIGGVIWGVYFHAVHSLALFEAGSSSTSTRNRGKGMILLLLVYLAPIVVGVILIIFMLKPLFSRPSHSSAFRALKREKEPLLFMFVDQVCDAVGAPQPVQINLDIQVNASAGFRRGWLSMLGNDLVLTIGMPLVASLSLRQFSGVLAHEFGHFSQGAGMRLSFIIRSINMWFMRVVYERDAWDERLEYLSQSIDLRISWVLYLARLFVWITRKVLWLLMMVGHLVSGFLMRQMEFDADRYEARLAGSRCFAATSKRLALLGVANQGALSDLGQFYSEGRLVDNFPALININLNKLSEEVKQAMNRHIREEQTGWFDTHPATLERIANIEDEDPEGIFRLKSPATVLFSDFKREAKFVTRDFYYGVFGKKIPREDLHSVDELQVRLEAENESHKAVQRFYQGAIYPNRPLLFSESAVQVPADAKQCAQELKSYREKQLKYREKYKSFIEEYREFESKSMSVCMAEVAVRARLKLDVDDRFFKSLTNYDKIVNAKHGLERKKSDTRGELEKYETLVVKRLERGLQLFMVPKVQTQIEDAALWERDLPDLLLALEATNSQISRLWELHMNSVALQILLRFFDDLRTDDKYCEVVLSEMEKMDTLLNSIYNRFKRLLYPFEHSRVDITIAEFALAKIPESNHPGELLGASEALFENLMALNHRVLGRLCLLAEQVETLLGFEVLPEYQEADSDESDS